MKEGIEKMHIIGTEK